MNPEHTWGHTIPFGEEYYRNASKLIKAIREDIPILTEVAGETTAAVRRGNTVYANISTGHMPSYELVNEREGNPGIFVFNGSDSCSPEQFAAMRAGDVLMTNHVCQDEKAARDKGVYVVVFTTCYFNNRWAPPGRVNPNQDNMMPEDVASRVVFSHIPWEQGLIHVPAMPYMPVGPGSANGSCSIQWMITAESAQALANGGNPDGTRAREYTDIVLDRIDRIFEGQFGAIQEYGLAVARKILSGGRFFVRSRNKGIESESNGVAQGLMLCNAFEQRPKHEGGDRDVMLIAAVTHNDPEELAWAEAARQNGNLIVGIGSAENHGLKQRCDLYIDNLCPEPTGVLEVSGYSEKICPVSGVVNNISMYMLLGQFIDEMCRRGHIPYFYMGGYRKGGGAYNETIRPFFMERGY
jgi:uncharacterized phosphosugar-binding protein